MTSSFLSLMWIKGAGDTKPPFGIKRVAKTPLPAFGMLEIPGSVNMIRKV